MLEIIGIIALCNVNKKNAVSRGRKPGAFIAFTILLWVGMEFIGAFIGVFAGSLGLAYVFALCFALIGGLISYLIAKNCKPGEIVTQQDMMVRDITGRAEKLAVPATIDISMERTNGQYNFFLNGQLLGMMKNDQTLSAPLEYRQNVIQAQNVYGMNEMASYPFNVENGLRTQISFNAGRFLPGFGIFPLYFTIEMPPDIRLCPSCGRTFAPDAQFCANCGAPVFGSPAAEQKIPVYDPFADR